MSREENSDEYFDSLCELDNYSQVNFEKLQDVLRTLKKLLKYQDIRDGSDSDADILKTLDILSGEYNSLVETSVDLRHAKYQSRESQIQSAEQMETENHNRINRSPFGEGFRKYIGVLGNIQQDSLKYTNMVERLSVDLAKQAEISDANVSRYDMNEWEPSEKLQRILNKYSDDKEGTDSIDAEVKDYLDKIKLARAKYALENKYSLQAKLSQLNEDVNYWRKEWDNMESLMFGDDPKSMRSMLKTIQSLKQSLMTEKDQEEQEPHDDVDVPMQ